MVNNMLDAIETKKGCFPQRWVLAIMGSLAIFNAYTMRVCFSVAITEMATSHGSSAVDPDACPYPEDDTSRASLLSGNSSFVRSTREKFQWDEATQGLVLSSFYWGYVISHIPGGILADKLGGKMFLVSGILCTSIFTLLTPLAASYGASWVIVVRFLEGLGEGTTFPAANVLLSRWAPPQERSKMGGILFSGNLLGNVIGTAASGLIIDAMDGEWASVFYVFGGIGIIWCIGFQILCYSTPEEHPCISDRERNYITSSIKASAVKKPDTIPWFAVLTSVPLWGLVIAQLGHDWVLFTMGTELPKYMSSVLHYKVKKNALLSALPNLAMFLVAVMTGWLSDWLVSSEKLSVTAHRKIFTTFASLLPGLGLLAASYAGCNRVLVVTLFTVGMACMGPFYSSLKVNALDLSPNYAGLLMAIVNGLGAVSGIVSPYLVGFLVTDNTLVQWRTVFWVTLGVTVFTDLFYILTASGRVQPWNSDPAARNAMALSVQANAQAQGDKLEKQARLNGFSEIKGINVATK